MESEGIFADGTATVAANGTVITFQNAGSLADLQPGDRFGGHVGLNQRISEVGPAAGLTASQARLAFPWKGPAQAAAPYEITYKPSSSGFRQSIKELVDKYGDGVLPIFAKLVLEANKGIHAVAGNELATHDLTAFMRGLLGAANGGAAYAGLGQIPNAQLPSRLRSGGRAIPNNNYNLAYENGFYTGAGSAAINGPPGGLAIYGPMLVMSSPTADFIVQIVGFGANGVGNNLWMRGSNDVGSTWSSWAALCGERGANANGSYLREPDGTQTCWFSFTVNTTANTYVGSSGGFPAAFIDTSELRIVASIASFTSGPTSSFLRVRPTSGSSWDSALVVNSTESPLTIHVMAKGRWF